MDIEQLSIEELLTQGSLNKIKGGEKASSSSFLRGRKLKYVVSGILILMALSMILFYFKNPLGSSDPLIDYNKYPFLQLTSLTDPDMKWDVFVDTPNNQVLLVKQLTPSAAATYQNRRLLVLNESGQFDETTITQVILHKFNEDHITIYQLHEGDFDYVDCLNYSVFPSFDLVPRFKTSQFSEKIKSSLDDDDGATYELKSSELGLFVEIKTDSQGELLETRFSNVPSISSHRTRTLARHGFPYIVEDDYWLFVWPEYPKPKPKPKPKPVDPLPNPQDGPGFWPSKHLVSFKVTEPFDIERIKTKLDEAGQCFEYDQKFNAPKLADENSKMKLNKIREESPIKWEV